ARSGHIRPEFFGVRVVRGEAGLAHPRRAIEAVDVDPPRVVILKPGSDDGQITVECDRVSELSRRVGNELLLEVPQIAVEPEDVRRAGVGSDRAVPGRADQDGIAGDGDGRAEARALLRVGGDDVLLLTPYIIGAAPKNVPHAGALACAGI